MAKSNGEDAIFFVAQVATDGATLDVRLTRERPVQVETARVGSHDAIGGDDSEEAENASVVRTYFGGLKRLRRSRKHLGARAKTFAARKLTREEMRAGAERLTDPKWAFLAQVQRPVTRRDCWTEEQARERMKVYDGKGDGCNAQRPCPFVLCKHHLYTDVNPESGSYRVNFPGMEVWQLRVTCALDVAEAGGDTLEGVGQDINLTRERIRQVEVRGLLNLQAHGVDTAKLEAGLALADKIREGEKP